MIVQRPLTSREKKIFLICVSLAFMYALKVWIYAPASGRMKELDAAMETHQVQIAKHARVVRAAADVDQQYNALLPIFQSKGSEGAEISGIVSEIEAAGKQAGLHIVNMQPQKAVAKDFYTQYAVRLTIDGPWNAIVEFLYILQNVPGLFEVQELNLENYSRASDKLKGRITLVRTRVTSP